MTGAANEAPEKPRARSKKSNSKQKFKKGDTATKGNDRSSRNGSGTQRTRTDIHVSKTTNFTASKSSSGRGILATITPDNLDVATSQSVTYPEYLTAEAAQAGVDDATMFEAIIRYNANDRSQAYCSVDGVDTDIFIEGVVRQNRSVHGDLVVIKILDENEWWVPGGAGGNNRKKNRDTDVDGLSTALSAVQLNGSNPKGQITTVAENVQKALEEHKKGYRATGEVVYVKKPSERRFNLVGCLRDYGPDSKRAVFVPLDGRLPLGVVIDSEDVYCHERDREKPIAKHYYEAKIVRWENGKNGSLPQVRLKGMLGKPGQLETDVQALLLSENVNDDDLFNEHILACLPATPWKIPESEYRVRRDLRQARIFSIDPETAKDLDDALSIKQLDDGMFEVGVHIADVSYFVKPGTALDNAAQERSTSVYLVDRVIPMLPRLLCEELCSLNPGTERLAMSIIWRMKADGEILDVWMGRTVINSCVKLSYQMAQKVIDAFDKGEALPVENFMAGMSGTTAEVFGNHTKVDIANDVIKLHKIARSLRKKRYDNGSLRLDNSKVGIRLLDGDVDDFSPYVTGSANHLVEEFMLAANISAAEKISSAFPERALLRRHPEPNMEKLVNTSDGLKQYLPDAPIINTGSAGAVQTSLAQLRAFYMDRPEIVEAITFMCTKPMTIAEYFNTHDLEQENWRHYALAIPMYTHFTSPIRRYPDIIVHRLIDNALKNTMPAPADVSKIALHSNERKLAAKVCQEKVTNLYLVKLLEERPRVLPAVVSGLGGPRFFDVYIPALGTDIRIEAKELFGGTGRELQAQWDGDSRSLLLKIATGDGPRMRSREKPPYPTKNKLENPEELEIMSLPLSLKLFAKVVVVVYGQRGELGNFGELGATLWIGG
jgi:VacB/RNase II family 3'-5' exoribonuclease